MLQICIIDSNTRIKKEKISKKYLQHSRNIQHVWEAKGGVVRDSRRDRSVHKPPPMVIMCTIVERSSAPSSLEQNLYEALDRRYSSFKKWTSNSDLCAFRNHCHSFNQNRGITSDQNNVSNWFHSNKDGVELFPMIVHRIQVGYTIYSRRSRQSMPYKYNCWQLI